MNYDLFTDRIDIFLSIHPQYANKILDGQKTIELRKRFPILNGFPARILIYSTTPEQMIVGYVEVVEVYHDTVENLWERFSDVTFIDKKDFDSYFSNANNGKGYGIELKNPVRLNNPISLHELKNNHGILPPQSYKYLNEQHKALFEEA